MHTPDLAPDFRHQSMVAAAIGAAFGLGAVSAAVLAWVWAASFPWAVAAVAWGLGVAAGGSAVVTVVAAFHAWCFLREAWRWRRASWWGHLVAYVAAVVAAGGAASAAAWFTTLSTGWLLCVACVALVALAVSVGATQYLRPDGPGGTLRAHLARLERARSDGSAGFDS